MRSHGLSRESSPYLEWDCEGTGSKLQRVPRALRFGLQLVVDQMLQTLKSCSVCRVPYAHTIPNHTIPYHIMYSTGHTIPHYTKPHHSQKYCAMLYDALFCYAILCHTNHSIPYKIIQFHTIPYTANYTALLLLPNSV